MFHIYTHTMDTAAHRAQCITINLIQSSIAFTWKWAWILCSLLLWNAEKGKRQEYEREKRRMKNVLVAAFEIYIHLHSEQTIESTRPNQIFMLDVCLCVCAHYSNV